MKHFASLLMKKIPKNYEWQRIQAHFFAAWNFLKYMQKSKMNIRMAMKSSKNINTKQADFVSRLTFIRGLKDVPEKTVYVTKDNDKDKKKKKYKHWCMPSQPDGYIKCRQHDFL